MGLDREITMPTFIEIVKNNFDQNKNMEKKYTIIIPSNQPNLIEETKENLIKIGEECLVKNGSGYPSFSKLINDCVIECPTEIVIICNDRARPKKKDVEKTLKLIDEGFGFVGLYAWGFFGFKKELFRRVGFMDERFIGGNYEDSDYMRTMLEADIAMYNVFEIEYREDVGSRWDTTKTKSHFLKKWGEGNGYVKRLLPEEDYNYNLGEKTNNVFLPWDKSVLGASQNFVSSVIIK